MDEKGDRTKVLVVDDESIITMQLRKLLTKAGYDVVGTAADGKEAALKAEKLRPDVILMDLVMPREHGLEAIPRINETLPGSAIIVVTALQSKDILTEALDAGAKDYLLKPYKKQDLLDIIKKYAA